MELVLSLKTLWSRRILVAVGLVAAAALTLLITFQVRLAPPGLASRQQRAWVAEAVLLVDSQPSPIGDVNQGLGGLIPLATLDANLMTGSTIVNDIAAAAKIPSDEIAMSGPAGSGGGRSQHGATVPATGAARYLVQLDTDGTEPLIRITTKAPTSAAALALANGAGAGLASYVTSVENGERVAQTNRIAISNLGQPTARPSESGIRPVLGIPIFGALALAWCMLVLLASRFRQTWRLSTSELLYAASPPSLREAAPRATSSLDLDEVDRWAKESASTAVEAAVHYPP
jgi:hypothetical protein